MKRRNVHDLNRLFAKLPHVFTDTGFVGAIGARTFLVYVFMLRYIWRTTHHDKRIANRQESGEVVCWFSQTKVARLMGVSRQTINRDVAKLKAANLVRELRLAKNGRAYVLGMQGNENGDGSENLFAADLICKAVGDKPEALSAVRKNRRRIARHLAL